MRVRASAGTASFRCKETLERCLEKARAQVAALYGQIEDDPGALTRREQVTRERAIEIPPGKPQIEYFDKGCQWTPGGDVLRCVISDGGPDNEPIIHDDNRDLSWMEFRCLLTTYAGWGMRLIFVPDNETQIERRVEVREPKEAER